MNFIVKIVKFLIKNPYIIEFGIKIFEYIVNKLKRSEMFITVWNDTAKTADADSGWYDLRKGKDKLPQKVTVHIGWNTLVGTMDGEITIYYSNDVATTKATFQPNNTISISSVTQPNLDLEFNVMEHPARYVKVVFVKNSITSIKLKCNIAAVY